ncbi:MAG: sodium pump decarboxylase gamma subunit [Lachnospiraceae bacterium]|nr:sodium pump decarboxylase gamma subunit [Lachnospiraceae bacterium]
MSENMMLALGIMGKGMLGIFVVIGVLALVVYLLSRLG